MRVRRRVGRGKSGRLWTFSLKELKKPSYKVSSVAKSVVIGQNNNKNCVLNYVLTVGDQAKIRCLQYHETWKISPNQN